MAGEISTGMRLTDLIDPGKNPNEKGRMIAERIQKSSFSKRFPEEDLRCIVEYLSEDCPEEYLKEEQSFKRGIYLSYHLLD